MHVVRKIGGTCQRLLALLHFLHSIAIQSTISGVTSPLHMLYQRPQHNSYNEVRNKGYLQCNERQNGQYFSPDH